MNVHVPACHVCAQIYLHMHVKQSPYIHFQANRDHNLLGNHAPVGGELMLPRTVSTPSMLNPRPLMLHASWQTSYQSSMTAECGCLRRRHPKRTPCSVELLVASCSSGSCSSSPVLASVPRLEAESASAGAGRVSSDDLLPWVTAGGARVAEP